MKRLSAEFAIIAAGILLALAADEWRQDREELRVASEHLADVALEIRRNLCTAERIRVLQVDRKMDNLLAVLSFLNDPAAPVEDPAVLLQAFARSTAGAKPWLVDNQFQALQNSGNVRLVRKLQPDLDLAGLYGGPAVLFSQIDRFQGTYPAVVNELIPAQLQALFSQLSGYARGEVAPAPVDDEDLARAIESIRARRVELPGLARNEAAVATGKWYALMRIRQDMESALSSLSRWDRSPTSLAEDLVDCAWPRPRQLRW